MRAFVTGCALATALTFAPPAAGSVTLGELDPNPMSYGGFAEPAPDGAGYHGCGYVGVVYVPGQPDGQWLEGATPNPDTTVPSGGGVITSWTIADEPAGSVFRLAVTRFPLYGVTIVARSAPETVRVSGARVTFTTHIAVSGGEQIALDLVSSNGAIPEDCFYWSGNANDFVYTVGDDVADGQRSPWMPGYGYRYRRVNVQARVDTASHPRRRRQTCRHAVRHRRRGRARCRRRR